MIDFSTLCPDSLPTLFGIFDIGIAPALLFYSYIPIILISMVFGLFILVKDKYSLKGKLIFAIATSFSLWVLNILVQWIASPVNLVHFAWELTAIFEVLIYVLSLYFVMVYVDGKDISFYKKLLLSLPVLVIAALLPTTFNAVSFDLVNCQSNLGLLWNFLYGFEIFTVIAAIAYAVFGIRFMNKDGGQRRQITTVVSGVALFLFIFSISNIYGEITKLYQINLIGPIGMVLFLSLLTYTIIKYRTFNIRIFAAQALVFSLAALVFGTLFVNDIQNVKIIALVTLLFVFILGRNLIKNVNNEIRAKENLQVANIKLQELDKQKTEFISFATHQLRSPLTAMKGHTSLLLEGDYGPVSAPVKEVVQTIFTSIKTMINIVEDYLNVSRIELGTMKYTLNDMDFKDLVQEVANEQKPNIEAKNLKWSVTFDATQTYKIKADPDKFKQVLMNTVDNSIKYTPEGSIALSLEKMVAKDGPNAGKSVVRFKVADTGVGIRADVIPKLFQKFSRAPKASEANIHGTGLGLFIAKEIMIAHGGRVWAESAGEGKGSQFYVEVPEVK
jgi:signal transduction histidine kinase